MGELARPVAAQLTYNRRIIRIEIAAFRRFSLREEGILP